MNTPMSSTGKRWLVNGFIKGSVASGLSMAVLAWLGRYRHGSSSALINAPSHWVHGDRALRANWPSLRYTLTGALIHHASSLFWALIYEGMLRKMPAKAEAPNSDERPQNPALRMPTPLQAATCAVGLTTLAWVVDTKVVPPRLTPGFERRSSGKGMLMIYGSFALGLTLATLGNPALAERISSRSTSSRAATSPL